MENLLIIGNIRHSYYFIYHE